MVTYLVLPFLTKFVFRTGFFELGMILGPFFATPLSGNLLRNVKSEIPGNNDKNDHKNIIDSVTKYDVGFLIGLSIGYDISNYLNGDFPVSVFLSPEYDIGFVDLDKSIDKSRNSNLRVVLGLSIKP